MMKNTRLLFLLLMTACVYDQAPDPADCSAIQVEVADVTGTPCNESSGAFTLQVEGGQEPYSFSINGILGGSGVFSELAAGNYSVEVSDAAGCSVDTVISILSTDGVNIDEIATSPAGCGSSEGAVTITASQGSEPYSFRIDGGTFQPENTFNSLNQGNHTVTVRDDKGCESSQTINLTSGVSFSQTIGPIIEANCAECHDGRNPEEPPLLTHEQILQVAEEVKNQTSAKLMPPPGDAAPLTDEQIELIACWVNDGAPNN